MKKINSILLVDDNPADNAFHKIKIREADVCNSIQATKTGPAALDYLEKAFSTDDGAFPKPDLIFLDMNLPGMDGFDFLDEYHKLYNNRHSKTVIIMLTTSLNPDDQKKALTYEEVGQFMNKPLTVDIIKATVDKFF